ncbi:hypothetical protein [Streptomyces harbinensis]
MTFSIAEADLRGMEGPMKALEQCIPSIRADYPLVKSMPPAPVVNQRLAW